MTTETVTMPTAYLAEKVQHLELTTSAYTSGGIDEVPVWQLDLMAELAQAILDEAEWWIAEARRREEERRLSRTGGNSGGETP